jgi:nucleoside-diphosphate-sugar epimerase
LVVGSEGNFGAPLVRRLRDDGYEILEVDIRPGSRPGYLMADINQPVDLLPAFDWKPEVVFVLSAMVSRVTCELAGDRDESRRDQQRPPALQARRREDRVLLDVATQ